MSTKELVLVTGGSGFIGSWCVLYALREGFRVRTTVRSLNKADLVREMLVNGGATKQQADEVEFVAADLTSDDGWPEACAGATYVLHVASPFPMGVPKNEDDLIIPARDGTLRALRAAKAAGTVKRIVITSSVAAITYGHAPTETPYTERTWTDLNGPRPVAAYPKSKTIAERAAWDFIEKEGDGMELATVNPVGVLGPVLGKSSGTSIEIVVRMLNGGVPFLPKLFACWVDVRDVAALHIKAMLDPKAKNERFIATADGAHLKDVAGYLKKGLPTKSGKVSTREVPNFLVKMASYVDPAAGLVVDELSNPKYISNEKAKTVLGQTFHSAEESVVSAGESCVKYGLVK